MSTFPVHGQVWEGLLWREGLLGREGLRAAGGVEEAPALAEETLHECSFNWPSAGQTCHQ